MIVNTPFAAKQLACGDELGIIAASAGAKKTVTVEMIMLSSRSTGRRFAGQEQQRRTAPARAALVTTRTNRLSSRSTYTPATAENRTAGPRKVRIRRLTAVLGDPVALRTMTVRP